MLQLCEALAVPHPEFVPSPQSKKYCTEWPRLEEEPPVVYVYEAPVVPLAGPEGVEGAGETVSVGVEPL